MKLYIYVYDRHIESFVRGDLGISMTISSYAPAKAKHFSWTPIGEVDAELDFDEMKLRQIAIDGLNAKIQEIRATAEAGVTSLEQRKQNLMALEHHV